MSGLARTAMAGAVGGMALWTAIFPADVVKSRMQVSPEKLRGIEDTKMPRIILVSLVRVRPALFNYVNLCCIVISNEQEHVLYQ